MIKQELVNFMGLSKREIKVFEFLRKQPNSQVATIVREIKIPRMSLYLTLKSLKRRGVADYIHKGKRKFWFAIPNSQLTEYVVNAAQSLEDAGEIRFSLAESGFAIHYGIKGVYKVWSELQKLDPRARVHGIQPTSAMKYALAKLDWQEKIAPLQENILKKSIIIDGVLPDDYYSSLIDFYAHDKKLQKNMLKSFLGRSTDMTFVSSGYFKDAESELIILPNVAFLTDWKNEISIEIRNHSMLKFLVELYELTKGYGKKVNQEDYIKKLIEQIEDDKQ